MATAGGGWAGDCGAPFVFAAICGIGVGLVRPDDDARDVFFAADGRGFPLCCGCAMELPSRLKKSPIGFPANDGVVKTQSARSAASDFLPMFL